MKCSVGGADPGIRFKLGTALVGAEPVVQMSTELWTAPFLARAAAIGTAAVGYCAASLALWVNAG